MSTITETPELVFSLPAPETGVYLGTEKSKIEAMRPHFNAMRNAVEAVCSEAGVHLDLYGDLTGTVKLTGDAEQLQIAQTLLQQRNVFDGLVTKSVFEPNAAHDF